jgi:hypothetical protein
MESTHALDGLEREGKGKGKSYRREAIVTHWGTGCIGSRFLNPGH